MVNSHEEEFVDGDSSDDELTIAQSLNGNRDAFGKLVSKYQGTITSNMRRFSRDEAVVEELVHDVFVEAFLSLRTFRFKSPFVHWLRKIGVRVGYRFWKNQSQNVSTTSDFSDVAERFSNSEWVPSSSSCDASDLLGQLLERLKPRNRLVLTLMYWEGLSIAEAAKRMGWSKTMVKVQAYRARKRLRKLLEGAQE